MERQVKCNFAVFDVVPDQGRNAHVGPILRSYQWEDLGVRPVLQRRREGPAQVLRPRVGYEEHGDLRLLLGQLHGMAVCPCDVRIRASTAVILVLWGLCVGHGRLKVRALVPLVPGGKADDGRGEAYGSLEHLVVIPPVLPCASSPSVPRAHLQVVIPRAHGRGEERTVFCGCSCHGRPVCRVAAVAGAGGCEVGVRAIKAAICQERLVPLLNPKAENHSIRRSVADRAGAWPQQTPPFCSWSAVRVIDVEDRQGL
mmetsp:Transcript_16070/g.44212  ORF Transcript_16070/g.44212 Transcript_16070/m.44212 type:complete len:256 (+) Transcript_16070:879-1646(+)